MDKNINIKDRFDNINKSEMCLPMIVDKRNISVE